MSALQEILIAFGGNAVLLIVLGFLADLQNTATAQLERLKYDLKSQGDASIEQLKSGLQQATIEHQVRFSRLHEKRAQTIEELEKRAYELELMAARYASTLGRGGSELGGSEMYEQAVRKLRDFDAYRDSHRIYLSDEVDDLLCRFIAAVKEPIVAIGVYGDFGGASHEELRRYGDIILKALQATRQQVPAVRTALIKEFRAILNGKESARRGGAQHLGGPTIGRAE
jgi:hypothetical protein